MDMGAGQWVLISGDSDCGTHAGRFPSHLPFRQTRFPAESGTRTKPG